MKARMSKAGSIQTLILISIIMLSGMALLASADQSSTSNKFNGNVLFNGEDAPVGAVISAYIEGDPNPRGTKVVETAGEYVQLGVTGYASDEGAEITFTVDGVDARETAVWNAGAGPRQCDLTAGTGTGDSNGGDVTLSADRSISGMICPGSTFTVTIDIDVTGTPVEGLGIADDVSDLQSGWTITPHNHGNYVASTEKVEWVWSDTGGNLGDQSVTYDVAIPGDAVISNSYDITGEAYMSSAGTVTTVDMGADTITVVDSGGVGDGNDGNGDSGGSGGISGSGTSGATPADTTPKPGSIPDEEAMPTPSLTPVTASETPAATPKEPGAEPEKNKGLLPGFEAIFAIAGLLAVAYLIRRR
jgi:PGF-CTERM protein